MRGEVGRRSSPGFSIVNRRVRGCMIRLIPVAPPAKASDKVRARSGFPQNVIERQFRRARGTAIRASMGRATRSGTAGRRKASVKQPVESRCGAAWCCRDATRNERAIVGGKDKINDLTLDNTSYRASIGPVGIRPNGPEIRATPRCCAGCLASCGALGASRCLCAVQWQPTIARAQRRSRHTSQRSDRTVRVRRQIQCRASGARVRSVVRHRERGAVRGRGGCEPGVSAYPPGSELPGPLPFALNAGAVAPRRAFADQRVSGRMLHTAWRRS